MLAKGYDSFIVQRDQGCFISPRNSVFLAKAGTGDVLSGLISGLLAQGFTALDGTCFAVSLHSLVAQHLRYELKPETMISHVGAILNRIDSVSRDVL